MSNLAVKPPKLTGAAQALVGGHLLTAEKAYMLQQQARQNRISLIQYLGERNLLNGLEVAHAVSAFFAMPLVKLDCLDIDTMPLYVISVELMQQYRTLPLFKRGHDLYLAVEDPSNHSMLNAIKFHTGLHVHCIIVESYILSVAIKNILSVRQNETLNQFAQQGHPEILAINTAQQVNLFEETSLDSPVIRFVDKIIMDAINRQASDIHFEPYADIYRIRFRIDGVLYQSANPPESMAQRIATRLKVMSRLDISERRLPQDGRFKMKISTQHEIDFRISTCPLIHGEKIVMRILDPMAASLTVENIGFNNHQKNLFLNAIKQPYGMILVTGPTGSGKTVTLYTALELLNTIDRNISTAEDPVEIKLNGVNQVHINTKIGLSFANVLRAFLRQDPDVIMVGEIRDLETAEIAIKAAQTGHLVLSTLHTNSAPETLTRLVNMQVSAFNIASATSLIIAQRLARKLCQRCKIRENFSPSVLHQQGFIDREIDGLKLYKAAGCEYCTDGYKGRIGLFEVMPVSNDIGDGIIRGCHASEVKRLAITQGMITVRQSGLEKASAGLISLAELNRITKD